jgi:hypothetical protein
VEVEYAFLADAADAPQHGGKLYLLGAGFDELYAPGFPVVHPYMAFVVKVKFHPSECGRTHSLEIELWDPDGQRIGPKVGGSVRAERNPAHPTRAVFAQVILGMFGTQFPRPGTYEFHIVIDDQHAKTVALHVEERPSLPAADPEETAGSAP